MFKEIEIGNYYIDEIENAENWYFGIDNKIDMYDILAISKENENRIKNGGNVIKLIHLPNGEIYTPFEFEKGVYYYDAVFFEDKFYSLKMDTNLKEVFMISYIPKNSKTKVIFQIKFEEVDAYNLKINDDPLMLISQDECFKVYYPEKITIPMDDRESFYFEKDGKYYFSRWNEIGDFGTKSYKYYEEVVVKDKKGNIIEVINGNLFKDKTGEYYIIK